MKRMECLDGLRGLLAVYVTLGHMAPFSALPLWMTQPFSHGGAAVDIFFMLSGLVIVRSLESFQYQPRPFLIARIARIFPVYLPMLALGIAVQLLPTGFDRMPWLGPDSLGYGIWSQGWAQTWPRELAAHLTMTHGLLPNGTLPNAWVSFLGSAWSLSTEWQFYLLALLLGGIGLRAPGMAAVFLLLMALIGVAIQQSLPEAWHFSRAFLPNKAHYFALGVASAALVKGGIRTAGLFCLVLANCLLLSLMHGAAEKLLPPLVWSICLAAQLRPDLPGLKQISAVLCTRTMLWLGSVSYSLYLANEPIQRALGFALSWLTAGDAGLFTAFWLPASILLPLGAAGWLRQQIEVPAMCWGRALIQRQIFAPTVARTTP